ncbi:hypothetical protein FUA23_09240 [Neolewinella aurantiaca]|uniref:Uncharacterized protein n=1 Tax=Neolewinella aurantiaca TaxID=2602767 RepID=A0A5C7FVJ7_9BACT|nr:hypothetical protein [Neolewinella aurantiaca]TXF89627.1 hypothetical protein FUA23_09240 [Neolewinella aurantiaca]
MFLVSRFSLLVCLSLLALTYSCVEENSFDPTAITFDEIVSEFNLIKTSLTNSQSSLRDYTQTELEYIYSELAATESLRGERFIMTSDQFIVTLNGKGKDHTGKLNGCNDPFAILTPAHCVSGGHVTANQPAGYWAPYGFAIDFDYSELPNGTMNLGWEASNITSHLYGFSGPLNWNQTSTSSSWGVGGLVVNVYGYISVTGSGGYSTATYHLQLIFDPWTSEWSITID